MLTGMMGSPVLVVPGLADVDEGYTPLRAQPRDVARRGHG